MVNSVHELHKGITKSRGHMEARQDLHQKTLVPSTFCRYKIHQPKQKKKKPRSVTASFTTCSGGEVSESMLTQSPEEFKKSRGSCLSKQL